jgi:lipopolysaccharide biosynthesis glycosyltransferase
VDISGPVVPWNKLGTYDPSKIINIVYVSGSKYQHYTYTSLISVLENSKPEEREEPIRFIIIYEEMGPKGELLFKGILDNNMTRLTNVLFLLFNRDIYKYDIEYIPIPDRERRCFNQFKTAYYWPKNIFLKLFLSRFLSCDKCIYLDGDTACVNDIRDMWNIDLGEYCFAGRMCKNDWVWAVNAGGLLYNLWKMRKVGFADEIEEILKQKQKNPSHLRETLEEHALYAYSEKHGHCVTGPEINMNTELLPYEFNGVVAKGDKQPIIIHGADLDNN